MEGRVKLLGNCEFNYLTISLTKIIKENDKKRNTIPYY